MIPIELFYGVVEDNNDPLKKGRLQIRLLPEMTDAVKNHLPWLRPFDGGGATDDSFNKDFLREGSPVWCFFTNSSFQKGWYISGVFLEKKFRFENIEQALGNISEESLGEYRDISFSRFNDGTIVFRNNKTGMSGHYHNSGSYIIFSSDGEIIAYSKKNIRLYNDKTSIELNEDSGNVEIGANGSIVFKGSGDNLVKYSDLQMILTQLVANMDTRMMVDPISGTAGPVMPPFIHVTFDPTHMTKMNNMKATDLETP